MANSTLSQKQPARITASARAGMLSCAFLVVVSGGIFAGMTNLNGFFSPSRGAAPLLLAQPKPAANYAGSSQPSPVISVGFDASGNPVTAPADGDSARLEPLQVPVVLLGQLAP